MIGWCSCLHMEASAEDDCYFCGIKDEKENISNGVCLYFSYKYNLPSCETCLNHKDIAVSNLLDREIGVPFEKEDIEISCNLHGFNNDFFKKNKKWYCKDFKLK